MKSSYLYYNSKTYSARLIFFEIIIFVIFTPFRAPYLLQAKIMEILAFCIETAYT